MGVDTSPSFDGAMSHCSPINSGGVDGSSEVVTASGTPAPSPLSSLGGAPHTLSLKRRAAVAEYGDVADPLAMGIRSSGRHSSAS